MTSEDFSRLEGIQQHIENARYNDIEGSLQLIYEEIVNLNAWKSFSGKMMAECKRDLNSTKVKVYQDLIFSERAVGYNISPSIAKDYIAGKCGELQYFYDFAERVNSACAYSIDSLRSILSALKQEMSTINYQGQ